jgi:hypothetical protein
MFRFRKTHKFFPHLIRISQSASLVQSLHLHTVFIYITHTTLYNALLDNIKLKVIIVHNIMTSHAFKILLFYVKTN